MFYFATWTDVAVAIAGAVAAVGTVGAVVVALYFQPLRERRLRADLRLPEALPDRRLSESAYYGTSVETITLDVTAQRGRRSAEEVEVLLTVSCWLRDDERDRPRTVFQNRPLPWFDSSSVEGPVTQLHMGPGVSRKVEVLKMGNPKALHASMGWPPDLAEWTFNQLKCSVVFAALPFPPEPTSQVFAQPHLHWRLRFTVTARDVDAKMYECELRVGISWKAGALSTAPVVPAPTSYEEAKGLHMVTEVKWTPLVERGAA